MKALITGATGQIAAYLAKHLVEQSVEVILTTESWVSSWTSCNPPESIFWRLHKLGVLNKVTILSSTLAIEREKPDVVFHLAANSYAYDSNFGSSNLIFETNLNRTAVLLDRVFIANPKCKFIFAGSSEQFGNALESPQNENTPFNPRNPYGIAKTSSFQLVKYYREYHKMWACSAILFNQESPLRDPRFVTKKISQGVVNFVRTGTKFKLGDLRAKRDWSHVRDTVEGLWLMTQQDTPQDFVFGSRRTHTIAAFLRKVWCTALTLDLNINGHYLDCVEQKDPNLVRDPEQIDLVADTQKAKEVLGWEPKTSFDELVNEMVTYDWQEATSLGALQGQP
jgi:GDPmannose 4,6-dehydratase